VSLSTHLAEKSVQAAISAIEIYNKPNFSYREEAFSLLMTNAWELLLKGKWLANHNEAEDCLHDLVKDKEGKLRVKTNRTGNPLSIGLPHLAAKLLEDKASCLTKSCHDNILALIEIRDNAAHFVNKDLYLGRRVLEVGTASLKNYLELAATWFKLDLSKYNFFLMPISFFHGFEAAEPVSRDVYTEQVKKLLTYLDKLEAGDENTASEGQHVALRIETKLRRSKDMSAMEFRTTNDPNAPVVNLREEDIRESYPLTYADLLKQMKQRYSDFKQDAKYHALRKTLVLDTRFCFERKLDSHNPKSVRQKFFNTNIFQEFDKHYERHKAPLTQPKAQEVLPLQPAAKLPTSGENAVV
jgi:Protein of unknown function (DUF3644)/EC042_2821-lke REase